MLLLRIYAYVIMQVGSHDLATYTIEDKVIKQSWHLHKIARQRPRDSMSVHTKARERRIAVLAHGHTENAVWKSLKVSHAVSPPQILTNQCVRSNL
jgi:hypothetical protein